MPEAARIPIPNEAKVREQAAGHLECLMRYEEEIVGLREDQIQRLIRFAAKSPLKGKAFFDELSNQKSQRDRP